MDKHFFKENIIRTITLELIPETWMQTSIANWVISFVEGAQDQVFE